MCFLLQMNWSASLSKYVAASHIGMQSDHGSASE